MTKRKFNNTPNKCYKIEGGEIWASRSVAVNTALIVKLDADYFVLAAQRGSGAPDFRGMWNVPSGYIDYDETCPEAAIREVYEETGVEVDKLIEKHHTVYNHMSQPWFVNSDPSSNRQNVSLRYGLFIILGNDKLPKLTSVYAEPNEISDLKWINVNEIENYQWAFNHDILIKDYLKLVKN